MRACAAVLALVVGGAALHAQTNDEINAGLQFSFSPPGARSMALGYAFVGRADDATAAYANPAGLVWLTRPEVSIEGRSSTFTTRYPHRGSATGSPTFCTGSSWPLGADGCLDTLEGPRFRDWESSTAGASFVSYVHPFGARAAAGAEGAGIERARERWRLAIYRHELANFRTEIDGSEGAFIGGPGTARSGFGEYRSRLAGVIGELDLEIQNLGLSAAYRATENFWVGMGISYYDFDLDAVTRRFRSIYNTDLLQDFQGADVGTGNPALPGPIDFSAGNEVDRHVQRGRDGDVAAIVGVLWKSRSDSWSVGAVYRQAPRFDFDYSVRWQARARDEAACAVDLPPAGELGEPPICVPNPDIVDPGVEDALSGRARFHVPDYLGIGFFRQFVVGRRSRFVPNLRLSIEYDRVQYSNLEPESNILLNVLGNLEWCGEFGGFGDSPEPCLADRRRLEKFRIDDADEWHVGLEYEFGRRSVTFLRAGAWLDPDHQMRYEFDQDDLEPGLPATADGLEPPLDRFVPRFAAGEDEIHVTGGLGFLPAASRFQVDAAFDLSARADVFSVSVVYFIERN